MTPTPFVSCPRSKMSGRDSAPSPQEIIIGTAKLRPPRDGRDRGSGGQSSIIVAKIALVGTVLAALITAAATVLPTLIKNEPPNTPPGSSSKSVMPDEGPAVPPSVDGAQVEFLSPPEDTPINAGDNVKVSGTVTGLGATTLWILSWHQDGGSFFPISGAGGISPVATKDGPWSITDEHVGDATDKGQAIVYTAVQADAECTKTLSAMHDYGSFRDSDLPKGCTPLPSRRGVQIK